MPCSTDSAGRPAGKRSLAAVLAGAVGVLALAATAAGPLAVRGGLLGSWQGFGVFLFGLLAGMLGAGLLGAVGLRRTRAGSGRTGRRAAWVGLAAAAALLLLISTFRPWSLWVTLHDATTRIDDPPAFSDAVRARRERRRAELGLPRVNTTDYPSPSPDHPPPISGEQVIAYQRAWYPDLAPIVLSGVSPGEAFEASQAVARELGWTVTTLDPDAGILEAFDRTPFFAFEDDVVVRVRAADTAGGAVVDVRSLSLYRANDLRSNANRIRSFAERLRRRVEAGRGGRGPQG